ncbi:hypothetical protein D3C81_1712970 [compost metagenome]
MALCVMLSQDRKKVICGWSPWSEGTFLSFLWMTSVIGIAIITFLPRCFLHIYGRSIPGWQRRCIGEQVRGTGKMVQRLRLSAIPWLPGI